MRLTSPLWAADVIFQEKPEIDSLYVDRDDWTNVLDSRYPPNKEYVTLPPKEGGSASIADLVQFLSEYYDRATKKVDWKREAYPAALKEFGEGSFKRSTVEHELRELGLIESPGRPTNEASH